MSHTSKVVLTTEGALRGHHVEGDGCSYYAFKGIPYAKPPVGPLRFMDPQPIEPWTGVRDAQSHGPVCVQHHMLMRDLRGEEDCLYLNVYTKYPLPDGPVSAGSSSQHHPVIVRIHGGGFTTGSGNSELYGPDYLLNEDIVVVTINYRLGALGFLSLEEPGVAQGNMGLKDQVAALRWVQRNIFNFGGDPKRVTIAGESAGGVSVHLHMLSPMSQGLFHNAIMESGVVLNPWALSRRARTRAFALGELLGCRTTSSRELLDFLRAVPAGDIVDASVNVRHRQFFQHFPFVPSIEVSDGSVEPFLAEDPLQILREGRFLKVPVMAGVCNREAIIILAALAGKEDRTMQRIDSSLATVIPEEVGVAPGSDQENAVAEEIRRFYFQGKRLTGDMFTQYVDLYGDIMFLYGFQQAMRYHVHTGSTYMFVFTLEGGMNIFKNLLSTEITGACHADHLGYLFRSEIIPDSSHFPSESLESTSRRRMIRMWTNFVKYSCPIPAGETEPALSNVQWSPARKDNMVYLDIGKSLSLQVDMTKPRIAFWDRIFNTYGSARTQSKL